MEMIKYLSIILSEQIDLSPSASAGLIRLAIKDTVGPFKPINQLNFKDYKISCEINLKKRLQKLNINNINQIIISILDELVQNQSLITMEKV
ncbi:MAG: hypothetical protein ACFE9S_17475 [Candidatus Hermodarchaeota archaeon]